MDSSSKPNKSSAPSAPSAPNKPSVSTGIKWIAQKETFKLNSSLPLTKDASGKGALIANIGKGQSIDYNACGIEWVDNHEVMIMVTCSQVTQQMVNAKITGVVLNNRILN
ncbi:hypothetical protein [Dellaglioa sp. BT-FLS60]